MTNQITFTTINNDYNGNPRYVCHWISLDTETYERALTIARKLGGKKFNNKQFGGGIVFSHYNIQALEKKILEAVASEIKK